LGGAWASIRKLNDAPEFGSKDPCGERGEFRTFVRPDTPITTD
jgi:diphthamide synthase (EF-2-diphthine--ammonia ligase)